MADDELDSLYCVHPDAFTAQRTTLSAAAKRRGDDTAAKQISAARKPTAAAWIVNRLALRDKDAKRRLSNLGDRLRDAHAAMDGDRIRELSAEQHRLINELARAAFRAADLKNPSTTVRDDVTTTLQAAIADPEVRARLGRLTKAERWSGFGAFGDAGPASKPVSKPVSKPASKKTKRAAAQSGAKPAAKPPRDKRDKEAEAAQKRVEKLSAAVAAAERAKAQADDVLSERQAERDSARLRRDEAAAILRRAERELSDAENRYEKAQHAGRAAAESVYQASCDFSMASRPRRTALGRKPDRRA